LCTVNRIYDFRSMSSLRKILEVLASIIAALTTSTDRSPKLRISPYTFSYFRLVTAAAIGANKTSVRWWLIQTVKASRK
jgi:uncharacterized protein YceH (UPF0502 family)